MKQNYDEFLKSKVVIAENFGIDTSNIELNSEYFADSLYYIKSEIYKMNVPTLFDLV